MFIQLKSQSHIDATKVMSIAIDGNKYTLKTQNGGLFDVTAEEFPWLVKICGFMIELKSGVVINLKAIENVSLLNDVWTVSLSDGDVFALTKTESDFLMSECKCMNLEARILQLQGYGVLPDDYKKIP